MEIVFGIIIISIILIVIILKIKEKGNGKNNKQKKKIEKEIGNALVSVESSFPSISIIENSINIPNERNLIKDPIIKKAVATIDNSVSNIARMSKNAKNGVELLNNNRAFFSTAKKGTENMMKVKNSTEVYGTQVIGNKFNAQTKFVNENELVRQAGKDALVNAGFNAASMVVGQYYMNEINNKLEILQDGIEQISEYLDSEYRGRMNYIISKMKEIVENKVEILSNEFSMQQRYTEILDLEAEDAKLLGQANQCILDIINDENVDYKKYENKTNDIFKWFNRQNILQTILLEIGNMRYTLANGNETSILSHSQYNNYLQQSNMVNEKLEKWHNNVGTKLGIDIKELRRNGSFFEIKKNTIGKIKEDWAYKKLNPNVVNIIENQTNTKKLIPYTNQKKDDVIKIQKYNGEYYNLIEEPKN